MTLKTRFGRISRKISRFAGSPICFAAAVFSVICWAATGPMFGFSETWQLVINTGTTIVTFLMVFLIQNTQNADTDAVHTKLDELIRAIEPANNRMLALEELDPDTLEDLRRQFEELAHKARDPEIAEELGEVEIRIQEEEEVRIATAGGTAN